MANLCSFSMVVVGKSEENINTFMEWMNQEANTWMGRGAEADIYDIEEDDGTFRAEINGCCKWSIQSSLIDNAISMRTEPNRWSFGTEENVNLRFVTLYEACKELDLNMEVYSEEPGCEFQEHYLFIDGELELDECVDYHEEFNEETEEYEGIGGFASWDFEI